MVLSVKDIAETMKITPLTFSALQRILRFGKSHHFKDLLPAKEQMDETNGREVLQHR